MLTANSTACAKALIHHSQALPIHACSPLKSFGRGIPGHGENASAGPHAVHDNLRKKVTHVDLPATTEETQLHFARAQHVRSTTFRVMRALGLESAQRQACHEKREHTVDMRSGLHCVLGSVLAGAPGTPTPP